jgi:SAM-dependent methyltransferase
VRSLRDVWHEQADEWARFARDPLGDRVNLAFNLPAFLELVPPAGPRTLDLGCGEGRVGAALVRRGHRVVGVDASPRMVAYASEHHEALVADAAALPFDDGAFRLVTAFMSLMDMDEMEGAVREVGRVLEPGGRLCAAVVHPINGAGAFEDDVFAIRGSYLEAHRYEDVVERDGFRILFAAVHRPLEAYSRALEAAGLLVEAVREPPHPTHPNWSRVPLFLHLRAVKP